MDKLLRADEKTRSQVFQETGIKRNVISSIIEKDFWGCYVLHRLFSHSEMSRNIIFKGGTSLSKVFTAIERFSEDIDLILNWNVLSTENPYLKRSNTQQDRFNKYLYEVTQAYLRDTMFPVVKKILPECKVLIDESNPLTMQVEYPVSFPESYILPYIQLEFGPLAAWTPHSEYVISSYVAQEYPTLFDVVDVRVKAVDVERTFWEKVTILHHEAHRPETSRMPDRYSRHYYDLYMLMGNAEIQGKALDNLDILSDVVRFKSKFYPRGWAQYELAKPGTMKIAPPEYRYKELKKDYRQMAEMIYGNVPDFEALIIGLKQLENEINKSCG
ncbi:MAG TPA: nucleotidyl transferase AbiEii/AbiGii toxin family protein [Candidatus Margulisbacteria bacterium]|nr:nucleotidyl transferase AbiEii/AbiGii toxin family protein [Candidatus Margulisiibacteriota bacterium]